MGQHTTKLFKAALSALYYTGAGRLMSPLTGGAGVIFTLHHLRPETPEPFAPNRILSITPDFLDSVLRLVIEDGFEIVSLDEVPDRVAARSSAQRPFACFTFDDGYRDNAQYAYPVFKRYGAPFGIYVPTDFIDGTGDLWWLKLEQVIRVADRITLDLGEGMRSFDTATVAGKYAAFDTIYWWLRRIDETRARGVVAGLLESNGLDMSRLCRDLVMTWDELRALAADPLVTIGAHTKSHFALARLPESRARAEIADSVARIEAEIGRPCRHFSFPYGCEQSAGPREFRMAHDLGLATAVTTQKDVISSHYRQQLTGLPRLSLNGDYQDGRYVEVLMSGAPFALWNALRRADPRRAASG